MFEYHGWVVLVASAEWPADDEPEPELSDEDESAIRALVEPLSDYALLDDRTMNGMRSIHMAGMPNHRRRHGDLVVDLFRRLGEIAPGSYGLLYVHDDEDQSGRGNEFQVFRMVRGRVTIESDPFLSPRAPTVEDPPPAYPDDDV